MDGFTCLKKNNLFCGSGCTLVTLQVVFSNRPHLIPTGPNPAKDVFNYRLPAVLQPRSAARLLLCLKALAVSGEHGAFLRARLLWERPT